MLQEEGLIEADINRRGRVTGLDATELDCLYAARISLEGMGVRVTAGRRVSPSQRFGSAVRDEFVREGAGRHRQCVHTHVDQARWLNADEKPRPRRLSHMLIFSTDLGASGDF
jgi:DNA-binding GntR family transcriptional regulator